MVYLSVGLFFKSCFIIQQINFAYLLKSSKGGIVVVIIRLQGKIQSQDLVICAKFLQVEGL